MSAHLTDDVLARFVACELGEQLALHVAEHLDACPRCATRADQLDPVAGALASLPEPVVPMALVGDVLREAARPDPVARGELWAGAAMLVAAAVALVTVGDPIADVAVLRRLVEALATALEVAGRDPRLLTLTASLGAMVLMLGASPRARRRLGGVR